MQYATMRCSRLSDDTAENATSTDDADDRLSSASTSSKMPDNHTESLGMEHVQYRWIPNRGY